MSTIEEIGTTDKSEMDQKSYRVISLVNGLKVLLISAPTPKHIQHEHSAPNSEHNSDAISYNIEANLTNSKLAACSLCVDVGSYSDPPDVQGLAHFLGKTKSN